MTEDSMAEFESQSRYSSMDSRQWVPVLFVICYVWM